MIEGSTKVTEKISWIRFLGAHSPFFIWFKINKKSLSRQLVQSTAVIKPSFNRKDGTMSTGNRERDEAGIVKANIKSIASEKFLLAGANKNPTTARPSPVARKTIVVGSAICRNTRRTNAYCVETKNSVAS